MTTADKLQWFGLAASWVLTVFTVAYNQWNAVFLLATRLRFSLMNPTALWTIRVSITGTFDESAMDSATARLKQHWPDVRKQLYSNTKRTLRANGSMKSARSTSSKRTWISIGPFC